jgi:hypothetical protein
MELSYKSVDQNLSCEISNFTLQFVTWFNTKMEMEAFGGIAQVPLLGSTRINPTELISDDGVVNIIDEQENTWPLRSLVADNLLKIRTEQFTLAQLKDSESFS